jgi:hypothetical protein
MSTGRHELDFGFCFGVILGSFWGFVFGFGVRSLLIRFFFFYGANDNAN